MIPLCVSLPLNFKFKILTSLVSFFAFDCKEKENVWWKVKWEMFKKEANLNWKIDKFEVEVVWEKGGFEEFYLVFSNVEIWRELIQNLPLVLNWLTSSAKTKFLVLKRAKSNRLFFRWRSKKVRKHRIMFKKLKVWSRFQQNSFKTSYLSQQKKQPVNILRVKDFVKSLLDHVVMVFRKAQRACKWNCRGSHRDWNLNFTFKRTKLTIQAIFWKALVCERSKV